MWLARRAAAAGRFYPYQVFPLEISMPRPATPVTASYGK
jgi:hypothetical protein